MDAAIALGLLATVLLLAFLPRKPVGGRAIQLFSSLFPSWRFFEEVEPAPTLHYRAARSSEAFGPWTRLLPAPARALRSLVLNADGNLALACHGLLEQLLADIGEAEITDLELASQLVSYRLVQRLVVYALPPELAQPALLLQFKLTLPLELDHPAEDVLVSEPFRLGAEAS